MKQQFKKEGWKIPNDIETWSLLDDFILPTVFTKNFFTGLNASGNKNYFYKNNKFINNNNNIDEDNVLLDNYFNEGLRF